MKLIKLIQLTTLTATTLASAFWFNAVNASTFEETEIEQDNVTAIARPFGSNQHDLLIIEQIADKQDCWEELQGNSGTVVIEPLLLNFDFTGICQRSTDSNGYSIRLAGQDLGMDYMLNVVERDGELVLLGVPRNDRTAPELLIGSTHGMAQGFLKINLYPGWRFTKRTFEGKVLGHIYLSNNTAAGNTEDLSQAPTVPGVPSVPTVPGVPSLPTVPGVPSLPTVPGVPTTTTDTTQPTSPTAPTTPTEPTAPTSPTEPGQEPEEEDPSLEETTEPTLTEPELPTLPTEPELPTLEPELPTLAPELPTTPGIN
jgi:hypothetical protein